MNIQATPKKHDVRNKSMHLTQIDQRRQFTIKRKSLGGTANDANQKLNLRQKSSTRQSTNPTTGILPALGIGSQATRQSLQQQNFSTESGSLRQSSISKQDLLQQTQKVFS